MIANTILPLWYLLVIKHLFLFSGLHGVYWIPIVFDCTIQDTEIESFHNM